MVRNFNKLFTFLTVTSLFLCSCGTVTDRQQSLVGVQQAQLTEQSQPSHDEAISSAHHYLELAGKATVPQSYQYQLMASEAFLQAQEIEQAEHWLNQVPTQDLSPRLQAEHSLVAAQIAFQNDDPTQALTLLNSIKNIKPLSQSKQIKFYQLQANGFEHINKPLESAQARAYLDELLLIPADKKANQEALWRVLTNTSEYQLKTIAQSDDRDVFTGWADLAYRLRTSEISEVNSATYAWQQKYPNHPGRHYLGPQPDDRAPATSTYDSPRQIALLLPLSGTHKKAAEAIRDGFLTRYYSDTQFHLAKPQIRIYDTTAETDIKKLYLTAVNEGAEFVIGPLMKENVYELSSVSRSQIKAPILALNQNRSIKHIPPYFYQFALAPEGEAEQLAQHAAQKSYRNAVIVVPNNPWGSRIIEAFDDRFSMLGGHVVARAQVSSNEDQAKAIRQLLNVENSRERSQSIKYSVREKVHFQPRRRQDIDVIIMAAPPMQARQLKPLFDFYYAQNIPILATSSVYSGTPEPTKDTDMNDVVFCDMPWLLSQDQKDLSAKAFINQNWPNEANLYARLFAMGVDTYELSSKINELRRSPQAEYPGATGFLSIGPNQFVDRRLIWATFKNGKPKLIRGS